MGKTEQRQAVMNSNYFEMTGRVTYVDIKYSEKSGNAYTRVLFSKKRLNEDAYDTFAFKFFGETAEKFAEDIKKGDTVNITGIISVNTFEKDGKKTEQLELIGRHYVKAEYDEDVKGYVAAKGDTVPWA